MWLFSRLSHKRINLLSEPATIAAMNTDPVNETNDAAPDDEERVYAERPNKTALKRETRQLRDLVVSLAAMPPHRLDELPLSERMRDSIDEYQRIRPKAHGGKRRQLHLVIKIARDEDMAAVQGKLDGELNEQRAQAMHNQVLVEERDRILSTDETLEAFIREHGLDNEFRALARKAKRELSAAGKSKAARTLLGKLQQILSIDG